MTTNFPSSLDNFTNPQSSDTLASPSHSGQHTDLNDAVEALEAKVGVDGSAVTSTLDYKVQSLQTNSLAKTIVDAKGDLLAATGADTVSRLGVGSNGQVLAADSTTGTGLVWRSPYLPFGTARLRPKMCRINGTTGLEWATSPYGNFQVYRPQGMNITSDFDIRMKVTAADWTPSTQAIVAMRGAGYGNNCQWALTINTDGTLGLAVSANGSTMLLNNSTAATGLSDGTSKWIRATIDVSAGAGDRVVKFYLSDNGSSWTQLGSTVTTASGAFTPFNASSYNLVFGGQTANPFVGVISKFEFWDGYDGAVNAEKKIDIDFEAQPADSQYFYAPTNTGIKSAGLLLYGYSNEGAIVQDTAATSVTGDIDIQIYMNMTDWTPTGGQIVLSKYTTNAFGTSIGYEVFVSATGQPTLRWSADGSTMLTTTASTAPGFGDGTNGWIRLTMDVDDGAGNRLTKFYYSSDGTSWTQIGTTTTTAGTTSIFDSIAPLTIGSRRGTGPFIGTIKRVIIRNGYDGAGSVVFDADFDAQTVGARSFTESSTNAATVTIYGEAIVYQATGANNFGIPNSRVNSTSNINNVPTNFDIWTPFYVSEPIVLKRMLFNPTQPHNTETTFYAGIYKTDFDLNPTGAPVVKTSVTNPIIFTTSNVSGVIVKDITPVTLQPGMYLLGVNFPSVSAGSTINVRGWSIDNTIPSGYGVDFGTATYYGLRTPRTSAEFPDTPPLLQWQTSVLVSSGFWDALGLLYWEAA